MSATLAMHARGIRRRVLAYTLANNGGYLSQACSSAEILAALYGSILRLGPSQGPNPPLLFKQIPPGYTGALYNGPRAPSLDRFIFSPVHYALVLYAALIEHGRLEPSALDLFNQDGSTVELIGAEHSPGHELTAGSLAQAISLAAGIALARKRRDEPGRTWVFVSDGEAQEGEFWECLQMASWYRLEGLCVVIDRNFQQCDGAMDQIMGVEPLAERLRAFGAWVEEVDGHDIQALERAAAVRPQGRPLVLLARTDPCRGIEILRERFPKLHYVRFTNPLERERYESWLAQELS